MPREHSPSSVPQKRTVAVQSQPSSIVPSQSPSVLSPHTSVAAGATEHSSHWPSSPHRCSLPKHAPGCRQDHKPLRRCRRCRRCIPHSSSRFHAPHPPCPYRRHHKRCRTPSTRKSPNASPDDTWARFSGTALLSPQSDNHSLRPTTVPARGKGPRSVVC